MSVNNEKYNKTGSNSYDELKNLLVNLRVPLTKTKEQAWIDFECRLKTKGKTAKTRSLNYLPYAIAAGIAFLISIYTLFYNNGETEIWCKPGKIVTITLPDGSEAVLNAASTLNYNKRNWNKNRCLHLEGEAFFHVKKGSRFEVVTSMGKIVVLGTAFNVFARDNKLEVYCETGKVAVESKNKVFLGPGMKAQTSKNSNVRVVETDQKHECTWQQGEFWFNNAPLADVIAEMERQFDVIIKYNDLNNRFYTGYFNRRSLKEALNIVFDPMQLKYKIENKTIQITN